MRLLFKFWRNFQQWDFWVKTSLVSRALRWTLAVFAPIIFNIIIYNSISLLTSLIFTGRPVVWVGCLGILPEPPTKGVLLDQQPKSPYTYGVVWVMGLHTGHGTRPAIVGTLNILNVCSKTIKTYAFSIKNYLYTLRTYRTNTIFWCQNLLNQDGKNTQFTFYIWAPLCRYHMYVKSCSPVGNSFLGEGAFEKGTIRITIILQFVHLPPETWCVYATCTGATISMDGSTD